MKPLAVLALALTSCAGTPPPRSVHLTAPACSYGGSVPVTNVLLDLDTDRPLTGVSASFALVDVASGAPRGVSGAYYQALVRVSADHALVDGIAPDAAFDGSVPAGTTRLHYAAGIDPSGSTDPVFGPLRVDVTIHANEGSFTASCATAELLPSS
jgi:hypothetical protein